MALITKKSQWYLISTDRSNDTIQSLSNRLATNGKVITLLDTYYVWNNSSNNYDKFSVATAGTLVINTGYWIYVNSIISTF